MHLNWEKAKKDLRNIFRCKYYRVIGKLTYPACILPRTSYIHKVDIASLINRQEVFVSRRSNKICEETFNELGETYTLREDAIDPIDVPNMSLNLMGGRFLEMHLKYVTEGEAAKIWNGVRKIYLSDFMNLYTSLESFCPIYFNLRGIHNQPFIYDKGKSPELTKEMQDFYKILRKRYIGGKSREEFIGEIRLAHVPTNLNYWHCEFKLQGYRGALIDRKNQGWIERLADDIIRNILCANGYKTLPATLAPITKESYIKAKS